MFVRAHRAALALTALVLIATGCGSNGSSKPVSLPSLSTTSSASASPKLTMVDDKGAVEVVVRRYYALLNGPTTVAAAQQLFSIMTEDCECRRAATSVNELAKRHEHYVGHARVNALLARVDGATSADALVDYSFTNGGIKTADGRLATASHGRNHVKVVFRLVTQGRVWKIAAIENISSGTPL